MLKKVKYHNNRRHHLRTTEEVPVFDDSSQVAFEGGGHELLKATWRLSVLLFGPTADKRESVGQMLGFF